MQEAEAPTVALVPRGVTAADVPCATAPRSPLRSIAQEILSPLPRQKPLEEPSGFELRLAKTAGGASLSSGLPDASTFDAEMEAARKGTSLPLPPPMLPLSPPPQGPSTRGTKLTPPPMKKKLSSVPLPMKAEQKAEQKAAPGSPAARAALAGGGAGEEMQRLEAVIAAQQEQLASEAAVTAGLVAGSRDFDRLVAGLKARSRPQHGHGGG